ncbi:MAG: SUMF1/EgtB/PvdO family nonheme iron enzyme [Nitrospirae bacterium]|nr:SUMF1/EgtB/PvdO family nonheme iron enzyme [Candidatus Manganitrophaceae bacterium]
MKRKGFNLLFALLLILGTGFLLLGSTSGQTVGPNLSDPASRKECRLCHKGPSRHQIDDSREPWCANCHQLHQLVDVLGLEAYRQRAVRAVEAPKKEEIIAQKMVLIPAGDFIMGEDFFKKNAGPRHTVHLDDYYIDQYDVTNAHYKRFVDATHRTPPSHWKDDQYPPGKANHPVTFVNWFDADAYCKWEGKHLPSEQEWEKAARGSDGRMFPWGAKYEAKRANVPMEEIKDTTPVNAFPDGRSPYGVYDMSGNVFQWTSDWFLPYPGNNVPHPNYGEKLKVLRGGSFFDCSYYKCGLSFQTFNRISLAPATKAISAGFRCAKPAKEIKP